MELIAIHRASASGNPRKTHISRSSVVKPLCGGGNGAAGQQSWDQDIQPAHLACSCIRCLELAVKIQARESAEKNESVEAAGK